MEEKKEWGINVYREERVEEVIDFIECVLKNIKQNSEQIFNRDLLEQIDDISGETIKLYKAAKQIASMPSKLFYKKVERFCIECIKTIPIAKRQEHILKLETKYKEESFRILNIIDHIEDMKKIDFLVKVYKAYMFEFIDMSMFYRLMRTISNALYEDLLYMNENITHEPVSVMDPRATGLVQAGLLIYNGLQYNSDGTHVYTESAGILNKILFNENIDDAIGI